MTAADLIEMLQRVDPESEVFIDAGDLYLGVCYETTEIEDVGIGRSVVLRECHCGENENIEIDIDPNPDTFSLS